MKLANYFEYQSLWIKEIKILSENNNSQNTDIGDFVSNTFGERYLFAVNRNVFEDTDANTVFRSHFGDSVLQQDTFYVIAGTDSGLLYHYIKTQGVPKGSRYLFVELPQVLVLLENLGSSDELTITTGEDWLEQAQKMGAQKFAIQGRLIITRSLGVVHSHYQGYSPFWHQLKESLNAYSFTQKEVAANYAYVICQINNLAENQIPAIFLKNTFKGKTAVLLAGGPSLDDLLPWLEQHRQNLLVIAVSRISHSLLLAGIQPDICVSIDPRPINLNISQDMLKFQNGTLLVHNNHLCPSLLSSWGGKKMFIGSRYPWATSLEPENLPLVSDGVTVTDAAFSLAVEMGVTQIILGGADFCFNQEGYTHASGSTEHGIGPSLNNSETTVETNSGMMADTIHGYRASALSIDLQARNAIALGCRTINPAAGAMRLPHVEYLDVDTIQIKSLEQPAHKTLENYMRATNKNSHIPFYKEVLGEVNRVLKELKTIKELSSKALKYNHKWFATREQDAGFHNKEKVVRIEKQLNEKYADTATFIAYFGITRFIAIRQTAENKNNKDIEESCRLYHQAMVTTSDELIALMRHTRDRMTSRLEEEKPQPNIQKLLKQWRNDSQPGRAIQWAKHHTNIVNQLSDTQQQALRSFQDTFYDTLKTLDEKHSVDISWTNKLYNIPDKTQEYFNNSDKAGLQRLLTGLLGHQDQTLAAHFISLVQGYLAELNNEPSEAIERYQNIVEGPTHQKALMRLFELHIKTENINAGLNTLKTLSSLNSTYMPMYADLLQATGDINASVETYTEYLLANPDDLNSMMKLGKIFLQEQALDGVAWAMSYILDKEPNNQEARQILNEIGLSTEPAETSQDHPE